MRTEYDSIGEWPIPEEALYGIHSARAKENFPDTNPFPIEWYKAVGAVKLACYNTYGRFMEAAKDKPVAQEFKWINIQTLQALVKSAGELKEGSFFEHFIVPAMQGGAGTSINMNVNEIIANRSLEILGHNKGDYRVVDPIEHANVFQSTNDVIPTSLKIAIIRLLNQLEEKINTTRESIEKLEKTHYSDLRIGYTQMQEAVPSSFGRLFSAYSDALSRDWWRISKCFERIKTVNLGGGAIGTGIAIPRFFIMEVVRELQSITGLPVARAENLHDATSNNDSLVEVHAILKAHAVNLEKLTSDLRLLAADIGPRNISIPGKQTGSSIMPGKINPVIPEFVVSAAHKIYANDMLISGLAAQGCLDLNAYLPAMGNALLESLKLLIACNQTLKENLLDGLSVNTNIALEKLYRSASITTALVPFIGYHHAAILANEMKAFGLSITEANQKLNLINNQKLLDILSPENILKLGYSLNDLTND